MASRNPRIYFDDPETLERMDQAFADIWAIIRALFATMRMIASLELPLAEASELGCRWSDRSCSASTADCGEPISPRPLIYQLGADRMFALTDENARKRML